jgi:hypothetical protein
MADAEAREIGHEPLGVRKGEALVELNAIGCARSHQRSRRVWRRARTCGDSKSLAAGFSRRRRQFGCSSIVPGRFGCSASPRTSSIGMSASGAGDLAVKASAASTAAPAPGALAGFWP